MSPARAIVEQGVDRFLEHPFFVARNNFRRADLDQFFQTVVAVDDSAVQIIQVGSRKPSAVQRHHRAQVGRNDRYDQRQHPFQFDAGLDKALEQFYPFERFFLVHRFITLHHFFQMLDLFVEFHVLQDPAYRFRADTSREYLAITR